MLLIVKLGVLQHCTGKYRLLKSVMGIFVFKQSANWVIKHYIFHIDWHKIYAKGRYLSVNTVESGKTEVYKSWGT